MLYSEEPLGVVNFQGLSRVPAPAGGAVAGALGLAATLADAALAGAALADALGLAAGDFALAAVEVLRFAAGLALAFMLSASP